MPEIPDHLSYSHLHLLACSYAAWLKYEAALESPTTIHLALGTSIHEALERTQPFDLYQSVSLFKKEYNRIVVEEDVFVGYPQLKKLEKEGVEMLELFNEQWKSNQIPQYSLAVEKEFSLAIAGTTLVGKIDRIDYDEADGGYTVSDYKSGKTKPDDFDLRHNLQLTAYAWAVLEVYGRLPKALYWWHLRTGERLATVRTMQDVEDLKTMIKNAVFLKVNGVKHRVYHEGICRFCDFKPTICEDRELEQRLSNGT